MLNLTASDMILLHNLCIEDAETWEKDTAVYASRYARDRRALAGRLKSEVERLDNLSQSNQGVAASPPL